MTIRHTYYDGYEGVESFKILNMDIMAPPPNNSHYSWRSSSTIQYNRFHAVQQLSMMTYCYK